MLAFPNDCDSHLYSVQAVQLMTVSVLLAGWLVTEQEGAALPQAPEEVCCWPPLRPRSRPQRHCQDCPESFPAKSLLPVPLHQ